MKGTGESTHTHRKKTYPSISVYYRHFKARKKDRFQRGRTILLMKITINYSELRVKLPPTIHQTFHIRKAWWCPWPTKHRGVPGVYARQIRRCSDHFLRFSLWVCLTIYGPWETSEIFRNPLGHHGSSAFALLIDRHNLWYNPL